MGWEEGVISYPSEYSFAMKTVKMIVEKHADGYIAYPVGVEGVVLGQGETYEEALADAKSALRSHIEAFGPAVLKSDDPVKELFLAEVGI